MGYIREIEIAAAPQRVWTSLTSTDEVTRWLAPRAQVDATPGGAYELFWDENSCARGRVSSIAPGEQLVVDWDLSGKFRTEHGSVRIGVRDNREGSVVTVEDPSPHRPSYDEQVAEAWEQALLNLKGWLEEASPADRWPDLG